MNKLSKHQRELLELALEKTYAFLKEELHIEISHDIYCIVQFRNISFFQCSETQHIAWDVCINLESRNITIVTRQAICNSIYSKLNYDIIYLGAKPIIHRINF